MQKDYEKSIICLIGSEEKKITIAIGVTNDIVNDYDSVELVNVVSETMKGKGGGGRERCGSCRRN